MKNRRYFQICIDRDLELCKSRKTPLSLILVDLDHFKKINDSFGHSCGDEVLKNTASVLRSNLRQDTTVARWGGEEFMILLPNVDLDAATLIAEKLRKQISEQTVVYPKGIVQYSASFGVASFPDPCGSAEELAARADEELHASKKLGRNRVTGRKT